MTPTSSILPASEYPQFASESIGEYSINGPLAPKTGDWYMYSQAIDESYKRMTRTIDLTGATSGTLKFNTTYDVEQDWDYVFVEAHTVGQDDWTTLPDENGNTATDTGDSCPGIEEVHPFLVHYQTAGSTTCTPTGTTGEWHAATGNSSGYQPWEIDLSQFAGEQVEVSISYASDQFVQGLGMFVDDTEVAGRRRQRREHVLRGRAGWLGRARTARRQPRQRQRLGPLRGAVRGGRRGQDRGQRVPRLRPRGRQRCGGARRGHRRCAPAAGRDLRGWRPGWPRHASGRRYASRRRHAPGGTPPKRSLGIKKGTVRVGKNRRYKVALRCPPSTGNRCTGVVRAVSGKSVLGRRSFRVTAGKYRTVTLRLTKGQYRKLVKRGRLRATVTVTSRDDAGTLRRKSVRLTLKPKK